jgi:DNA polymerase-3 subunit delta'
MDFSSTIDTQRTSNPSITPDLVPAQLWVGPHDHVMDQLIEYLQEHLCPKKGCRACIQCRKVKEQQHHSIMWICPEKSYTLDDIADIFPTIAFTLDENDHFFFILQKADFLTPACANSLLKSMEEPPPGYHFILLAERQEQILPTIRSRCITKSLYTEEVNFSSPLFNFFATIAPHNPIDFAAALDQSKINERESIELLDALLAHWIKQYKSAVANQNEDMQKKSLRMVDCIKRAYETPPMPGSSKIFWKNVFLMMK